MTSTQFLIIQIILTLPIAWLLAKHFGIVRKALARTVVFMAGATFSFDYVANDRLIWTFVHDWKSLIIINPIENTLFTIVMTIHAVAIHLLVKSRKLQEVELPHEPTMPSE